MFCQAAMASLTKMRGQNHRKDEDDRDNVNRNEANKEKQEEEKNEVKNEQERKSKIQNGYGYNIEESNEKELQDNTDATDRLMNKHEDENKDKQHKNSNNNKDSANMILFMVVMCCFRCLLDIRGMYYLGSIRMFEKQFGFTSTESAFLQTSTQYSGIVMFLVLGYLADHINKARMIAVCSLVTSICAILLALPYFTTLNKREHHHNVTHNHSVNLEQVDILCNPSSSNASKCDNFDREQTINLNESGTIAFYIFFIVRLILGAVTTPHENLVMAFVHENAQPSRSSMYLGRYFDTFYFILFGNICNHD